MTVELFGMARALVGTSDVDVAVAAHPTLRELLRALAARYPQLAGTVIDAATGAPIEPNLVLLDGRRARALDERVAQSDKPCLLFLPSGG